jgi:hypothetical protein
MIWYSSCHYVRLAINHNQRVIREISTMAKITISSFPSDPNFLVDLTTNEAHQILGGIKIGGLRNPCKPRGSLGKVGYRMPHL